MAFRDVYEVNRSKIRDRENRLLKLFVESPATAVAQARRLADESARYNLGTITRNFNLPTTALFMLQPATQRRFRYRKIGERTVDGARYWLVRGTEEARPTLVRGAQGRDIPLSTEYHIDPDTGRVARTRMWLAMPAMADILVDYRADEKLGIWVPSKMDESYDVGSTKVRSTAVYANFRRFQVSTDTAFRN